MTLHAETTDRDAQLDELLEAINPDSDECLMICPSDNAVAFLREMDYRREGGSSRLHATVPQILWLAELHVEACRDVRQAREGAERRQRIQAGQIRQPKAAVWDPDLGAYAEPV